MSITTTKNLKEVEIVSAEQQKVTSVLTKVTLKGVLILHWGRSGDSAPCWPAQEASWAGGPPTHTDSCLPVLPTGPES